MTERFLPQEEATAEFQSALTLEPAPESQLVYSTNSEDAQAVAAEPEATPAVELIAGFSAEELSQKYREFGGILVRSLARRTGTSYHDAEDAVQMAFESIWKGRFNKDELPHNGYIYTAAFRSLISIWNKNSRVQPTPDDQLPHQAGGDDHSYFELLNAVANVLDDLPPQQRSITVSMIMEKSVKEIADNLKVTPATVRSHLVHIRAKMRARATEEGWKS